MSVNKVLFILENPDDLEKWLQELELCLAINEINQEKRKILLSALLKGPFEPFYQTNKKELKDLVSIKN